MPSSESSTWLVIGDRGVVLEPDLGRGKGGPVRFLQRRDGS